MAIILKKDYSSNLVKKYDLLTLRGSTSFNGSQNYQDTLPILPTGKQSIKITYKANSLLAWSTLLSNRTSVGVDIAFNTDKTIYITNVGGGLISNPISNLIDNNKHTILFTLDSTGVGKIYFDDFINPIKTISEQNLNNGGDRNLTIASNPSGNYKFTGDIYTVEIYNEVIEYINELYLIKQTSNYYTIKTLNYDSTTTHSFIPLTLTGGSIPNKNDIETFGFDDLNVLTNSMMVNGDTFIPINKFDNTAELKLYKG
jgi:hypothetical protein